MRAKPRTIVVSNARDTVKTRSVNANKDENVRQIISVQGVGVIMRNVNLRSSCVSIRAKILDQVSQMYLR